MGCIFSDTVTWGQGFQLSHGSPVIDSESQPGPGASEANPSQGYLLVLPHFALSGGLWEKALERDHGCTLSLASWAPWGCWLLAAPRPRCLPRGRAGQLQTLGCMLGARVTHLALRQASRPSVLGATYDADARFTGGGPALQSPCGPSNPTVRTEARSAGGQKGSLWGRAMSPGGSKGTIWEAVSKASSLLGF